ncbi:FAD-dependent oxidoreductase [Streptomyces cupreus]|uniref:FAD-dependent monooxygenase n=1 Tax=Streptomyces cupreus TaxID=2759956 RepID=A0A7X1J5P5_9ACTN|nr:FAD-dependent oxidoreductase [Streptomyces cupreus]MBC2904691.1 FAD-dependent monooxygenase [Streptomyces cupreus]
MHVVVCGAGPVGAVTALLLAGEGHRVTVLDKRPQTVRSPAGSDGVDRFPGAYAGPGRPTSRRFSFCPQR